jgi:hypothetical protein
MFIKFWDRTKFFLKSNLVEQQAGPSDHSVWGVYLDRLYADIVGSNAAKDFFVYSRLSVSCCTV